MPVVSHIDLSFSILLWTFKLLPSKHTETSMWHSAIRQYLLGTSVRPRRMIRVNILCFKWICYYAQLSGYASCKLKAWFCGWREGWVRNGPCITVEMSSL